VNATDRVSSRQVQAVLGLLNRDEKGDAAATPGLGRVELLRAVRAALAVPPVPMRTACGGVTAPEAVAFQAGQAAALAAVRAAAELAWEPTPGTAGDTHSCPPLRREMLGGEPERAVLRAALRAVLAISPLQVRANGDAGVGEDVVRAFDAGQRAALAGVATAVGVALRKGRRHPARQASPAGQSLPGEHRASC
jgi:hypothetical protein